jgi:hypothetical protein
MNVVDWLLDHWHCGVLRALRVLDWWKDRPST